jgi:Flp pilus assembly protein TadD
VTQAYLLLAQASEQQQDFVGAERWLARVDNPQRALEVQARRASLLARQGKMKEARELIRKVPEQSPGDARAKLLAETELLRDRKMYAEAVQVMAQASKGLPDDTDLLYEQAMMAEKLDRVDEMERLLRRVIAIKPDHQHAYNALGYSLAERKIRLAEARTLIQKALELSPGEPSITDSMGWVEYRLGNREEAIRLLRGAYQARPDPEIAAHLGEVLGRRAGGGSSRVFAMRARATRRTTSCAKRWRAARRPVTGRGAMPLPRSVAAPTASSSSSPRSPPPARRCRRRHRRASDASGRLALRVQPLASEAPRSISAAFDLRGDSSAGTLDLSTPLGSMLAQARWSPAEVVLTTPRETVASRPDELTREALGESVPIEPSSTGCAAGRGPGRRARPGCRADHPRTRAGLSPARLARRPVAVRRRNDRGDARSARAGRDGANPPRRVVTR